MNILRGKREWTIVRITYDAQIEVDRQNTRYSPVTRMEATRIAHHLADHYGNGPFPIRFKYEVCKWNDAGPPYTDVFLDEHPWPMK